MAKRYNREEKEKKCKGKGVLENEILEVENCKRDLPMVILYVTIHRHKMKVKSLKYKR